MRTWENVMEDLKVAELETINSNFDEEIVKKYNQLTIELEELKPTVKYTTYRYDNGWKENSTVTTKLFTDNKKASEYLELQGAEIMKCKLGADTQWIGYYNIDGEWYTIIIGLGGRRNLQEIGTKWAKNMKKTIKMYGIGNKQTRSEHEATYNPIFDTVTFA